MVASWSVYLTLLAAQMICKYCHKYKDTPGMVTRGNKLADWMPEPHPKKLASGLWQEEAWFNSKHLARHEKRGGASGTHAFALAMELNEECFGKCFVQITTGA